MLHDFVHTENHNSKIFEEVKIQDEEIREACKNHHTELEGDNKYHKQIRYYDRLASGISRKKEFTAFYRYDLENGQINFKKLRDNIESRQQCPIRLYEFIHHSQDLSRIVESLKYGKSSLRNHILLMVNLAINDYYKNKAKIKIISPSASKRDDLATATDVEKHSFIDHNNAESKSATNSMRKEARSIGKEVD
jgi:hypothetical protein